MIPFYVGICDKGEEGQMHTEMCTTKNNTYSTVNIVIGYVTGGKQMTMFRRW